MGQVVEPLLQYAMGKDLPADARRGAEEQPDLVGLEAGVELWEWRRLVGRPGDFPAGGKGYGYGQQEEAGA